MAQPTSRRAFTLGLLLMGTGAAAQTSARELRSRRVVLSGSSAESIPELRVALGVVTTMTFEDAVIDARELHLEGRGSRVKLVDVGEHSVVLKPLVELARGERLLLQVPFADGKAPTQATFALVSHPAEVDSQVEVIREARSAEACQGELADAKAQLAQKDAELEALRARAAASGPAGLIFAGLLGNEGVTAVRFMVPPSPDVRHGLRATGQRAMSFRAAKWTAVAVEVENIGEQPWQPRTAMLVSVKTSRPIAGTSISMEKQQLGPGESALVVVETEPPSESAGEEFRLELFGADGGRDLSIPKVRVHNPSEARSHE